MTITVKCISKNLNGFNMGGVAPASDGLIISFSSMDKVVTGNMSLTMDITDGEKYTIGSTYSMALTLITS